MLFLRHKSQIQKVESIHTQFAKMKAIALLFSALLPFRAEPLLVSRPLTSPRTSPLCALPHRPREQFSDSLKKVAALTLSWGAAAAKAVHADGDEGEDGSVLVVDSQAGFTLRVPAGWTRFPAKTPTPTMLKYQTEESLFVANCFAEGASMGVTRTNAVRLLKDFGIEWWFAPLNSMADLGSPELISELLLLQRQGDFERKMTAATILSSNINSNTLDFEFLTPLAESVNRRTIARAIFRPESSKLTVVWISALSSVVEGDYGRTLQQARESFRLIS